jgi:ABC-type lipoprotein export system ATPase subunit
VADPTVVCRDVARSYRLDPPRDPGADREVRALRGVSLVLPRGAVVALMGPSGSGKSTLLRVLACVDRADRGVVMVDGVDTTRLSTRRRRRLRRQRLGLVVQNPADNLLDYLTVRQHLCLAAQLRGLPGRHPQIGELLDAMGLTGRADHLPRQLSGGEQQRVALAFAALGRPALLLADEPTGQLDHRAAGSVLDAFRVLAAGGMTVLAATHDPLVAARADLVVRLRDGGLDATT